VAERIELRLGPALGTLEAMLDEGKAASFDLAYVDADKNLYDGYYEGALALAGMPAIRVTAVAAALVALALTGLLLLASREAARAHEPARPDSARFEGWMALAASALAGLGIVYNTIPALMLPLCG